MPPPVILKTELGVLVQGCGLATLESMPPGSVQLVVADPPYNLGKSTWDRFPSLEDYLAWTCRWLEAARKALSPTGAIYVMGFSETLARILVAAGDPWHSHKWLVWYYRNKANLKDDWGRSHESLLLLRKGKRFVFNTDPVRIPYNRHTLRYPERVQAKTSQYGGGKRRDRWRPHPLGARPRDVLEIPVLSNGTKEKTAHPTQKPVQLIRRLVLSSSNPGDLVVDPFSGSGTTALVAELQGRRWHCVEENAEYLALAKQRLRSPETHTGSQTQQDETRIAARRAKLK